MSDKNLNSNIQKTYFKYNHIRTKLLLFIDNEIHSKIKQNNKNFKFNYENEITLSFEETFTQQQTNKNDFTLSNIQTIKNDNLDKSLLLINVFSNKITEKIHQQERGNIHSSKTVSKECNHPNKPLNNIFRLNRKFYSIKNLSKHSSTFLILPKQKRSAEYLKNLCNNFKKSINDKKTTKHIRVSSISSKFFNLSKDKKTKKNEVKMQKSRKDNLYTFSLFKKSQKGNFLTNTNNRISGKSANSNLVIII